MNVQAWNRPSAEVMAWSFVSDYPLAETALRLRDEGEAAGGWAWLTDRMEVEIFGERVRIVRQKVELGRRQRTEFVGVLRQGEQGVTLAGEFRLTGLTKVSMAMDLGLRRMNQGMFREDVEWMARCVAQKLTEPERWVPPPERRTAPVAGTAPSRFQGRNLGLYEFFCRGWRWYYQLAQRWNR